MKKSELPKYANFKFVKELNCKMGSIPAGSELTLDGPQILFNGIMVEPWYIDFFVDLMTSELEKPNYLKQIGAPHTMYKVKDE